MGDFAITANISINTDILLKTSIAASNSNY